MKTYAKDLGWAFPDGSIFLRCRKGEQAVDKAGRSVTVARSEILTK